MKILGIESSCDESAVALIEIEHNSHNKQALFTGNIIKKRILDQYITTHNNHNYGGIIPESVARQHYYYLPKMIARLKENHDLTDIDMVCATHSPGLIGGLMLGTCAGKAIATSLQKPFYPIHHIEGHVLSATFENNGLKLPYICLIASGGHTLLALVEDFGKYKILGQSADDAMGELFDKIAKYLGLPFPGGPEVERLASLGTPKYILPIPKIKDNEYGFSFSGLKTAIIRLIHEISTTNKAAQMSTIDSLAVANIQNNSQANNSHFHTSEANSSASIHASNQSDTHNRIDSLSMQNNFCTNDHGTQVLDTMTCNTSHLHNTLVNTSNQIISIDTAVHVTDQSASQHTSQHTTNNTSSFRTPPQNTLSASFLSQENIQDICASVQHTVVQLCKQKFSTAIRDFPHIDHYVMAGGVGANKAIRGALNQLMSENNKQFFVPEMKLCTDNALMIAWTGYLSVLYERKPNLISTCMNTKSIAEITNEYYTAI